MLHDDSSLGYRVVGFIDDNLPIGTAIPGGSSVIGRTADVADLVPQVGATGVIVAMTSVELETANQLARRLTEAGVHVELSSGLLDIATARLTVRALGRFPVVYLEPVAHHGWRAVAKRAFDILSASAL